MTAGFQAFNTATNTIQIDDVFKNYVLDRIVTIPINEPLNAEYSGAQQGRVAISAGELVAIRSSSPSAFVSVTSGYALIRSLGTSVTCYVFAPISTSSANYGLQVFRSNGELAYCATKKPLSFAGIVNDHSDFVYNTNKIYAVIMLNQYYRSSSTGFVQGGQVFVTTQTNRSMVSTISGGARIAIESEFLWVRYMPSAQWGSFPQGTNVTASASLAKHAIIDVTNY